MAQKHLERSWLRIQAAKKRGEGEEEEAEQILAHAQEGDVPPTNDEDDDNDFLQALKAQDLAREVVAPASTSVIRNILEKYYKETKMLDRKENVLQYWYKRQKTHPELYELSCVALAVPVTQVSVERLFSSLKFILHPLRMNMQASLVEDLLLVRNNAIFMGKGKH